MDERIDALAALVEHLVERVQELEAVNEQLTSATSRPSETLEPGGPLSRRRMLRALGTTAAVGVAAVGTSVATAGTAAAAVNDPLVIGMANDGAVTTTSLTAGPTAQKTATLSVTNSAADNGVNLPVGLLGVAGPPQPFDGGGGVVGSSFRHPGVAGFSSASPGVFGSGPVSGVHGS